MAIAVDNAILDVEGLQLETRDSKTEDASDQDEVESNEDEEDDGIEDEIPGRDPESSSPLFAPFLKFVSINEACDHDIAAHSFDLKVFVSGFNFDLYQTAKVINFLRERVSLASPSSASPMSAEKIREILGSIAVDSSFLMDDKYLKPFDEEDSYLRNLDMFASGESDWSDDEKEKDGSTEDKLREEIAQLKAQLASTQAQLEVATALAARFFEVECAALAMEQPSTQAADAPPELTEELPRGTFAKNAGAH
jgi:hypothetical protein